jgi:drug/metabolite transporter (DMT)-like permease
MSSPAPTRGSTKGARVLSDNVKGAVLMAVSMAAFVTNDTLIKLASADVALFQAMFLRGLVATALILAIALWRRELFVPLARRDRPILILRLVGEVGATTCFLTALFNMPIANVTAILQALPLAVTLGAAVFLREPVGWRRWLAIAVGFVGVLIIVRPGSDGFNEFSLLALAAVGFVVLRDLTTRRLSTGTPSILVALFTAVGITIVGGALAPFTEWRPVTDDAMVLLAAAACFLVFGYLFSVMVMRVGEIAFVAPFRYSVLLFAIVFGILVFDEFPDEWTLLGSAILVVMGLYTFHRERVRGRRRTDPTRRV